jgi:hypothetical protein
VDRTAELRFALDVDDLATADPRGRRNPRRPAEREVAEPEHGTISPIAI